MSCGEPETDPLVIEDPLDCGDDNAKTDNHLEVSSEEARPRLRMRKPDKIDLSEVEDDSDSEWRPSVKKARRGKRPCFVRVRKKNVMKESDTDSNEENVIPTKSLDCSEDLTQKKDIDKSVFCEYCPVAFPDSKSLREHLNIAHNKSESSISTNPNEKSFKCQKYYEQLKTERKYQCDICHKTFITSGHLNTHMYRHSGKKWTCDGCGKNFSCERSLIRHKDTFPGEHSFPCKYCDIIFFRLQNMVKHIEIKHPDAELDITKIGSQIPCKKCSKTFPSPELLAVHEKAMHVPEEKLGDDNDSADKNEEKYKCDICSKKFVSSEGFEYHKTHQHVEKDVTKKKRKKGKNFDDVDEELISPAKPNMVCKICSATFTSKLLLQAHLKTHNMTKNVEVKQGSLQCCICPRSFTSSDGLKYHLATHTGERRYSCNQCGKRFIKKTHLSEHIATHSEIKYFKCRRCPRTFSTHSAYRKHIKHFPGPHSFPCSKCGKIFTKESMIEKHLCVDLVKITMAPEVKALLSEDMIEEYLCMAEEQMVEELGNPSKKQTNDSHSCYKCFKVFPNLSSLQEHQNEHVGKQNYQCRFCPEHFKRADSFGAHIRNHLGSTPYMCLKCNRKFISPVTLSMHAKTYPGDHSFTCQKCQRWFPSEARLEKHECILQNSDHFKCACGSTFSSWNELLQHAGTKPYKCCSCELKYPTLMALARHIKKHTGVKPFSCDICGKSFRVKSNYINHQGIHLKRSDIQCEHCDYKSKSQKRMDLHLFRRHDIGSNVTKSTLCPVCGVMVPYISQMKKHLELEHGNEMILDDGPGGKKSLPAELCTLCGKMLNNKYTLANHMKKVHDPNYAKKDKRIKCEFCEEKFYSLKKLQRHAEVHETPGLRHCEICQKEFYFAKDLRKHMRKHDTSKPFSCSRCGKHFKVSASLKYHSAICGNVNQRTSGNRKKKEAREQSLDVLYGHINPMDLNNQPYMLQIYGR